MTKEEQREEIARLTQEYLDRGGVIEVIPPRTFLPACYRWMLKYGWSYTPWNHMGGLGSGMTVHTSQRLAEGCTMTLPTPFEGSEDE